MFYGDMTIVACPQIPAKHFPQKETPFFALKEKMQFLIKTTTYKY